MPAHIHVGITVVNQADYDLNVPKLIKTRAHIHFISVEPMQGFISLAPYADDLSWVICGGETGKTRNKLNPEWVYSLLDQCLAHNIPFFFKSWGAYRPADGTKRVECSMIKSQPKERPRLLDSRIWDEFPNQISPKS
jgi:protein gp37